MLQQTVKAEEIIVVNDNSTDGTQSIIEDYIRKADNLHHVNHNSSTDHLPGSKVINAFYKGFEQLNSDWDIIVKLDADLILPADYFERVIKLFQNDEKAGIAGGLCYIEDNGKWVFENISSKNHVRGPIKAYRKACFEDIGGLKSVLGWDTADVLLAAYHDWKVVTDKELHVKHLKPTGKAYDKAGQHKQGETLYRLRYGFWISCVAALKIALAKNDLSLFFIYMKGYRHAKNNDMPFLFSEKEGVFVRKLRRRKILQKLIGR